MIEKKYKTITFGEEKPTDNQEIFCIIRGKMMCLTYQGFGYPLYCYASDDAVPYMINDVWLKEI